MRRCGVGASLWCCVGALVVTVACEPFDACCCVRVSLPCCILPRCLAASLPRCLAASLPRCLAASLPRCLAASLPRCFRVAASGGVSWLLRAFVCGCWSCWCWCWCWCWCSLPHSFAASLCCCFAALFASPSRCLTTAGIVCCSAVLLLGCCTAGCAAVRTFFWFVRSFLVLLSQRESDNIKAMGSRELHSVPAPVPVCHKTYSSAASCGTAPDPPPAGPSCSGPSGRVPCCEERPGAA